MYCKKCGGELNSKNKFCIYCGKPISVSQGGIARPMSDQQKEEGFPWFKFVIAAFVIGAVSYTAFLVFDSGSEVENHVGGDILYELEPTLRPVGNYTGPSLFKSETIADNDWLSHIEYTEPTHLIPVTISNARFPDQYNTYSSVVKIVCEDNDYYYYGSGTNVDSAGYVVTNLHVIEGNADLECVVGFSDPETGLVREAYWATPIVDDENGTGHDLAMLSVEEPVFDDEYNVYGFYEKFTDGTFPYYKETDACLNTAPQLGDSVFVLGYPALSGGALTITDGLVSSLYSADGYIITSAKIGSGNSGGLAVDSNNCFVGVPTAVYYNGQGENYGEIIDAYFVYEFFDAVSDDIEKYSKQFE